jgi:hypothetical protein
MAAAVIHCSSCAWPLPPAIWNSEDLVNCPGCGVSLLARAFPALARAEKAVQPEPLALPSEASCFYHPQNQAVTSCAQCGRFLCSLCELQLPGRVLCPACFNANVQGHKEEQFESARTLHDSIALALVTVPILVWPLLAITAPLSLYWTIRHWKSPRSVAPRTRIRFYFAALFALGEIGLMVFLIVAVLAVRR